VAAVAWEGEGSRFVGRDELVEELAARFERSGARLVTITGRGGVGKTRLALELVEVVVRRRGWTAALAELAHVQEPAAVLTVLADALGVVALPTAPLASAIARRLGTLDAIVVVDNLEHLVDAGADLDALLRACPRLRLLATSQVPLRIPQEQVIDLGPLVVPPTGSLGLEDAMQEPSVALYVDRATHIHPGFRLDAANVDAVAELCRLVEGLPLGIELAAARVRTLPPAEAVRRLRDGQLDVLRDHRSDDADRHGSLRSAIAWSCSTLDPPVADLFARLGVPIGAFDLDDVALLAEPLPVDPIDALGALVDVRLVDPIDGTDPPRFSLPSTLREAALEQLAVADPDGTTADRWLEAMADRARQAAIGLDSGAQDRWRRWLLASDEDLVACVRRALEVDRMDLALALVSALGPHLMDARPSEERVRLFTTVVERASAQLERGARLDHGVLAEAEAWAGGIAAARMGDADRARAVAHLEAAVARGRTHGESRTRLVTLSLIMRTAVVVGPSTFDLAAHAREGLEVAEAAGDALWTGRFQIWNGMLAHVVGDDERAIALGRAGLAAVRRTGDGRSIVPAVLLLAPLAARHPEAELQLPSLDEAVQHAKDWGQVQLLLTLLPLASLDALDRREVARGSRWWCEALELVVTLPTSPLAPVVLLIGSAVAAANGRDRLAVRLHASVEPYLPLLDAVRPPAVVAAHAALLERLRSELGDDRFEAELAAGRELGVPGGVSEAAWLAEELSARGPDGPVAPADAHPLRRGGEISPPSSEPPPSPLTDRQIEVVRLLATGMGNKEIAGALGLTSKTVMHHTTAIYRRLGVRGRSEAVAWAVRAGLVD
jgi:predicted ATPase/DNA-binding CsgD family transcriptional regulator